MVRVQSRRRSGARPQFEDFRSEISDLKSNRRTTLRSGFDSHQEEKSLLDNGDKTAKRAQLNVEFFAGSQFTLFGFPAVSGGALGDPGDLMLSR